MKTVTEKDVTEYQHLTFTAEASSLGITPGKVPQQIPTELGNGQPFQLVNISQELLYRQQLGCIQLIILND